MTPIEIIIAPCVLSIFIIFISKFLIYAATSTYSKKKPRIQMQAQDIAKNILITASIYDTSTVSINGVLSDNYDPRTKTISLSKKVYGQTSIMAVAVAAHEVGHALQHKDGYKGLRVRRALQPLMSLFILSCAALLIVWFFTQIQILLIILCLLVLISVVISASSLPSEFDASRRAVDALQKTGKYSEEEIHEAKLMLRASAFTYVAGLFDVIVKVVVTALVLILLGGKDKKRK
jgi:uncharacterized protein